MPRTIKYAVFLGTLFLMCLPVYAASVGDTVEPLGHLKPEINVEYSHVFERNLGGELDNDATTGDFSSGEISAANQVYAKLALGVTDYLNIYGKIGAANAEYDLKEADGTTYDIETEFALLWGGGISGSWEIYEGLRFGADAQVALCSPDIDTLKYTGGTRTLTSGGGIETVEFQAAALLSKDFDISTWEIGLGTITPYAGVSYGFYKTVTDGNFTFTSDAGNTIASFDLENDDNIGVILGSNLDITDAIVANIEGRFVDETAMSGSLAYKF